MELNLLFYLICLTSLFRCINSMYRNYSLERNEVCPLHFNIPEISIGRENYSSVIVYDGNYFKKWNSGIAFNCKFSLRSGFGLSIIGVVQTMYLRKNETTGECIDYIQFGHKKQSFFESSRWDDRKLCGELSKFDRLNADSLKQYSISDKTGHIYVNIHVDRKPHLGNTTLRLEIVFTSFKECRINENPYRMCDDSICIHKNYFNDLIVNCPGCSDENSCYPEEIEGGDPELNTKVTVTAVTSIFLSFFLFLGCMMLCRYFLLFRQWHQPAPVTTVEMTPPPPDETTSQPSAPPSSADKDLPPAYETLFPDR